LIAELGNANLAKQYYRDALNGFIKVMPTVQKIGNREQLGVMLNSMGTASSLLGDKNAAFDYFQRSLKIAEETGSLELQFTVHQGLSNYYESKGIPAKALFHYKESSRLKDSVHNDENTEKLIRSEMNFEFEKKEALERARQEKKDALADEELKRNRMQRNYFVGGFILVLLLAIFIFNGYRQKKKANTIIVKQKEEVDAANRFLEEKNAIIAQKQTEITDSINYAQYIQKAILPNSSAMAATFPNSFVLYLPKDIVSGDFYWFDSNGNETLIAAADCTGHGIPGALMSILCSEKLTNASKLSRVPGAILKQVNKDVKTSLRQSDNESSAKDGMDIALCSYFSESNMLNYSGANRPLWLIRNQAEAVEEIRPTKKAIGGYTEDDQEFETHNIALNKGDCFYLFTDGFADQTGGDKGKKLMTKVFRELLLEIHSLSMDMQKSRLEVFVNEWKQHHEQVDDILVIGIRV
jgi:serine phosphatase RsbU (regulator of sigma subunit)